MISSDYSVLCNTLLRFDSEEEIITALKDADLWDNESNWETFGGLENNFSIIGNQQSKPVAALVEKIINSIDAMLLRECLRSRIKPDSDNAPLDMFMASEKFFGVRDGILSGLSTKDRRELADNIVLMSTGSKKYPSFTLIDKGEGQTPEDFSKTFLSIAGTNKLNIPFVQGKFNSGGTGSLQFCGKFGLQLIISRKDPKMLPVQDESIQSWGFTIVRRFPPKQGYKSSSYKYLIINGKIPTFKATSILALPGNYPNPYEKPLEFGTVIKMYEYNIGPSLRSQIVFDLYNRLSLLIPNTALPVLMAERREGFTGHTMETVLSGLSVRLEEDKRDNLEIGFPDSTNLRIGGQELGIKIYAFKRNSKKKYSSSEGVIFTVNGQTHGSLPEIFFTRKNVDLSYLKDSILVTVDCSDIDNESREKLFMNSRDRLRESEYSEEIIATLEHLLKDHQGLKELKASRRMKEISQTIGDSKPVEDVLNRIVSLSPVLSQVFTSGNSKVVNPFDPNRAGTQEEFLGKEHPTYFDLPNHKTVEDPKNCNVNRRFRLKIYTDVVNDYLEREKDPGTADVYYVKGEREEIATDWTANFWNGICNLNIALPEESKVGEIIKYILRIFDPLKEEPWEIGFYVKVLPEDSNHEGVGGKRINPSSGKNGTKQSTPSTLKLPNIIDVGKMDWGDHNFFKTSAIDIKSSDDNIDLFVNMDNIYLLSELKRRTTDDATVIKAQFRYGLALYTISHIMISRKNEDEYSNIQKGAEALAMILIPILNELNSLIN